MASERSGHPFHLGVIADGYSLGVEVVHVLRPVLDRGVTHVGVIAHVYFDCSRMQVRRIVLRRRAALYEVQVGIIFCDDEGVLELAGPLGVEAEIGLEGIGELHAGGHVDE